MKYPRKAPCRSCSKTFVKKHKNHHYCCTECGRNHYQSFKVFHQNNPEIYDRLLEMSYELLDAGFTKWNIRNLWENIRYDKAIDPDRHGDHRKLNDHHHAYYARLLMEEPGLEGFFTIIKRSQASKLMRIS